MWIRAKLIKLWFFQEKVFWCMTWCNDLISSPSPPPEHIFSKNSWLNQFCSDSHDSCANTPTFFSTFILCSYKTIKRLGIVPGTWFGEKGNFMTSNVFFHDILYTVRFVWMRRIQWYYFHYIIHVGRQSPQANTAFLILHYDCDAGVI